MQGPADCPDLEGPSTDVDLQPRAMPGRNPVTAVPGANDRADAALLRLCRVMTAATLRAGNARQPALSASHIRVLTVLAAAHSAGLPLTAVAGCLGATQPAVSRVCAELADRKLLTREAHGEELRVFLTPAGAEILTELNRDRLGRIQSLLARMPAAGRADVLSAAEALARATAGADALW